MSYLNVPRLHFTGKFQADPSTVNNNDANFDPTVQLSNVPANPSDLSNTSVYWNPTGTHNWKLQDCTVRGAANDQGQFTSPSSDPIIGARVISSGKYPAKIVDLDPDNQCISQIWGLQVQIVILDPTDSTKVLASVNGSMPPTAFCDLWNRGKVGNPGMPTMCACFQGILQNVTWVNPAASPLLAVLYKVSQNALSIRFNVDSFQSNSNQENFTFGRVVGTIGPVLDGDAPRSTPRRLAPIFSSDPSIMSNYGAAGAAWDSKRNVLILDLGNCVPTNAAPPTSGPTVPLAGWPINETTFKLNIPGPTVTPPGTHVSLKSGGEMQVGAGAPSVLGTIDFTLATYLTYAGIVEIPVSASLVYLLQNQAMTLYDVTNSTTAVREDLQGRYVDVDVPYFRLSPGDSPQVTLWATKFGQPWSGASLDVALVPQVGTPWTPGQPPVSQAQNGGPWPNAYPPGALTLSSNCIITGSKGTGVLNLAAGDPGTPRTYPDGMAGPDGQVYWITGSWANWGMIFLFPGMGITSPAGGVPINVLLFSGYTAPVQPTWDNDVGPILSNYARMFPYMKGIIDLGDYDTVKENAVAIHHVLNLPVTDPHHMPIVRDLSPAKLKMINQWIANDMPKSPTTTIV